MSTATTVSRRLFLKAATAAGGGLMLGCYFSPTGDGLEAAGTLEPNVWVRPLTFRVTLMPPPSPPRITQRAANNVTNLSHASVMLSKVWFV